MQTPGIQNEESSIDPGLRLGPDAGRLDNSVVSKTFVRPDVEAEFRRWRTERALLSDAVLLVAAAIVAVLRVVVSDAVVMRVLPVCHGVVLLVLAGFDFSTWRLVNTRKRLSAAERVSAAWWLQVIHLIGLIVSLILGASERIAGCASGVEAVTICEVSVRLVDAAAYFLLHHLVRNPRMTTIAALVLVIVTVFGLAASGIATAADVAQQQALLLAVNAMYLIVTVQRDNQARSQFRSILQLEHACRLHAKHRDRLAYVVRRALPPRFAHRLSSRMASGAVIPLAELYDSSSDAIVCATAVQGFSDWSTKQLQESGVLAIHRLFTLFDDGIRLFDVDPGCAYGDWYLVTSGLIRGSHGRASRVLRFALWQLHVRVSMSDDGSLNNSVNNSSPRPHSGRLAPERAGMRADGPYTPAVYARQGHSVTPLTDSDEDDMPLLTPHTLEEGARRPKSALTLHSVVTSGALAGGMTGTRELRYFLTGSALRRAEEVLPRVPGGELWVSDSIVHLIARSGSVHKFDMAQLPDNAVPRPTPASMGRGLWLFYNVKLPFATASTRNPSTAGNITARSIAGGTTQEEEEASSAQMNGGSDDGHPRGDEDEEEDEVDLADIAQLILDGEGGDGQNPLDLENEVLRSAPRTRRLDRQTIASYRGTNLMSFVSRRQHRERIQPTLETCSGGLSAIVEEAEFVRYAKQKAARNYPFVAATFLVFFCISIALLVATRSAFNSHNMPWDAITYLLGVAGIVVSTVTLILSRRYMQRQRVARLQALRERRIAAAQKQLQTVRVDHETVSATTRHTNRTRALTHSNSQSTVQGGGASAAGSTRKANSTAGSMTGVTGQLEAELDELGVADDLDEFVFADSDAPADDAVAESLPEPWLSHAGITAVCMLLYVLAVGMLFAADDSVLTNNAGYVGLCLAPVVITTVVPPLRRPAAILFVCTLVLPVAMLDLFHSDSEALMASIVYLLLYVVGLNGATMPSASRLVFHLAHYAHTSKIAVFRHSDVLSALLRRVVPFHVVKRGAEAVDNERELITAAKLDPLTQLRSAQLGERVPRDIAVVDEFTDLAVIIVRLAPPDNQHTQGKDARAAAGQFRSAAQSHSQSGSQQQSHNTGSGPTHTGSGHAHSGSGIHTHSSQAHTTGSGQHTGSGPRTGSDAVSVGRSTVTLVEPEGRQIAMSLSADNARETMLRWVRIASVISSIGGDCIEHVQSLGDSFVLAGPFNVDAPFRDVQRAALSGMVLLGSLAYDLGVAFTAVASVDEATGALVGRRAMRYGVFGITVRQCEELLNAVVAPYIEPHQPTEEDLSHSNGPPIANVTPPPQLLGAGQSGSLQSGQGLSMPDPLFWSEFRAAAFCTRSYVAALAPSVAHDWSLRPTEREARERARERAREGLPPDEAPSGIDATTTDVRGFPAYEAFPDPPQRWRVRSVGLTYLWKLDLQGALSVARPEVLRELGGDPDASYDDDMTDDESESFERAAPRERHHHHDRDGGHGVQGGNNSSSTWGSALGVRARTAGSAGRASVSYTPSTMSEADTRNTPARVDIA